MISQNIFEIESYDLIFFIIYNFIFIFWISSSFLELVVSIIKKNIIRIYNIARASRIKYIRSCMSKMINLMIPKEFEFSPWFYI